MAAGGVVAAAVSVVAAALAVCSYCSSSSSSCCCCCCGSFWNAADVDLLEAKLNKSASAPCAKRELPHKQHRELSET